MALRVEQIFVKGNATSVVRSLRNYVRRVGKRFIPHRRYKLDGVRQTLEYLVRNKKRRRFCLYQEGLWTVIWEIVDYAEFADPGIARWLSKELKSFACWIKLDMDWNIWAFQAFENGIVKEERFLPESYFSRRKPKGRKRYGFCVDYAERFNNAVGLPAFLVTLPDLERSRGKFPGVRKIAVSLNPRSKVIGSPKRSATAGRKNPRSRNARQGTRTRTKRQERT